MVPASRRLSAIRVPICACLQEYSSSMETLGLRQDGRD